MNKNDDLLFRLNVQGAAACFRRPEFVEDLVTYDVMPPPVARKLLESIYKPVGARWKLRRLHVLMPICTEWRELKTARGRKRALVLTDVRYVIDAELIVGPHDRADHVAGWRAALLAERSHPHLGLSDFTALISEVVGEVRPTISGMRDLGWMLYDLEGTGRSRARYFNPLMIDGTIDFAVGSPPILVS